MTVDKIIKALESMAEDMEDHGEMMKARGVTSAIWLIEYMTDFEERAEQNEPSGCWVKENQGKQICDDCIKNTDCSWR